MTLCNAPEYLRLNWRIFVQCKIFLYNWLVLMKKIFVLGYFGYASNQVDGQTIKTRNIYGLLKSKEKELRKEVVFFDTQELKKSRFEIFRLFYFLCVSDNVFYMGAQRNLKYLFPFFYCLCWLFRKDMHFVVVGGWLVEFLEGKLVHKFMLKKIKAIYPETKIMCEQLGVKYGFKNVHQLNNFRMPSAHDVVESRLMDKFDNKLRLVFLARVQPMKGVDVVFDVAKRIKLEGFNNVAIDIYGPVKKGYEGEFENKLSASEDVVFYRGVIQPSAIYQLLLNYDLMLFPTRYYTEGFPGSILDAYTAGVPVVVSNWKYAEEFVEHNFSGLICDFGDDDAFVLSVLRLLNDKALMQKLKFGAKEYSAKYSSEAAWRTFSRLIHKVEK